MRDQINSDFSPILFVCVCVYLLIVFMWKIMESGNDVAKTWAEYGHNRDVK